MLSSNITSYFLKIATLIFLLNLILFLLKEGKTKTTIKFIFSCIIVLYAVVPITSLKNCENETFSLNNTIELQEDFLINNSNQKKQKHQDLVKKYLNISKITYKNVDIIVNEISQKIENVDIILESEGINQKAGHILSLEDIKNTVSNILCVKSEIVNVEYD